MRSVLSGRCENSATASSVQGTQNDCCATSTEEMISQLLRVAGGDLPLSVGEALVSDRIRLHMDQTTLRGKRLWRWFVRYLRHVQKSRGLRFQLDRVETTGDEGTAYGNWINQQGEFEGQEVSARFRRDGHQIVELWTKPENYQAVFGPSITSLWRRPAILARGLSWNLMGRHMSDESTTELRQNELTAETTQS